MLQIGFVHSSPVLQHILRAFTVLTLFLVSLSHSYTFSTSYQNKCAKYWPPSRDCSEVIQHEATIVALDLVDIHGIDERVCLFALSANLREYHCQEQLPRNFSRLSSVSSHHPPTRQGLMPHIPFFAVHFLVCFPLLWADLVCVQ